MRNQCLSRCDWVIGLVCAFAFFVNNHIFSPDIMESRNIVTAREMVYDGNWLLPTMNGEWRMEKPPLPTWLAAVAEIISPDNISVQRGMAGIFATLLVLFFYAAARQILQDKRFAVVSSILLCTCYSVSLMGRTASWDIYCHAFMMGAIYYLIRAFRVKTCPCKEYCLAGVFMGLSFMSKGPVSFYALLAPFLIAYRGFYRIDVKANMKYIVLMAGICFVIGSCWYVGLYLFHGEELMSVIDKESSSWINRNVRPWYYYWDFFLEAGIWAMLLVSSVFLPVWSRIERKKKEFLFLLAWMLVTIVLLSFLPEKKKRYLLPVMISASYLMGYLIVVWEKRIRLQSALRMDKVIFRINASLVAVGVMALPFLAYFFVYRRGYLSLPFICCVSCIIILLALGIMRSAIKLRPLLFVGCVVALFFVASSMLPSVKYLVNNPEKKSIAGLRELDELKNIPFYHNEKDPLRIELVYAAHRKIKALNVENIDSVRKVLPCAVLTHDRVGKELPAELWESVDSIYIGRYDDNNRLKGSRRYSNIFIYHVTLLKGK